ncbi:unnamed protein product [Albugo candida]|uniref:Uncharacterized protein n=1 Tax=Albugo candida TaxID=65357 RepID=A0A024GFN0_9STRA|nr:unnamed protein product [Albugo candida]|eukprot:CCI45561.1 unnamed protein product [Albugo candida]
MGNVSLTCKQRSTIIDIPRSVIVFSHKFNPANKGFMKCLTYFLWQISRTKKPVVTTKRSFNCFNSFVSKDSWTFTFRFSDTAQALAPYSLIICDSEQLQMWILTRYTNILMNEYDLAQPK